MTSSWEQMDPKTFLPENRDHPLRKVLYDGIHQSNPRSVLEVGFGSAYDYEQLRSIENETHYIGVEITNTFLESAIERFPEARWLHGSVLDLPIADHSISCVYIAHVLEHLTSFKELRVALSELARVTRDRLWVLWFQQPQCTAKHSTSAEGFHYHTYDLQRVEDLMSDLKMDLLNRTAIDGEALWEISIS